MPADTAEPTAERHLLRERSGDQYDTVAVHLGHGSSDDGERPRWFEVDLYYEPHSDTYLVHTQGMSRVAGEQTYARLVRTSSAYEIVELLRVYHNGKNYIPRQSMRALAQAAQWDDNVRDVYLSAQVPAA